MAGWYKGRFLDLYRKAKKLNEKCFPRGHRNSRKKAFKIPTRNKEAPGIKKKSGWFLQWLSGNYKNPSFLKRLSILRPPALAPTLSWTPSTIGQIMHEIQGRLHIDGHALENSGAVQASGTLITTHLWEALSRALQISI